MERLVSIKNYPHLREKALNDATYFYLTVLHVIDDERTNFIVDDAANPNIFYITYHPFVAFYGDVSKGVPDDIMNSIIERMRKDRTFIVCQHPSWESALKEKFGEKLMGFPRTFFDASALSIEHLTSLKKEMPAGYEILPLTKIDPVRDQMIYVDLTSKYFDKKDFSEYGFGYGLYYDNKMIGFCCSNFPVVRDDEVEVYVRVDFNDDPVHRHKGFATQLAVRFLLESLKRNLTPIWDAANDISANLAEKLGYVVDKKWTMYYIDKIN
ncbi:MAG TPA: GNAT family N-acetyltransferase [Clostridia bacterium]|nr:GNAT family N-acetyltransferase [Clostridia bacterium]